MVDPPEEGESGEQPLLERLLGASERVVKFLTQGVVAECTEEQFKTYLQEAQPVAE
jgi:hypothetical protein